jgi:hypothetical protein
MAMVSIWYLDGGKGRGPQSKRDGKKPWICRVGIDELDWRYETAFLLILCLYDVCFW